MQQRVDLRTEEYHRLAESAWPRPLAQVFPEMACALNLMVVADLSVADGVWSDIRSTEAAVDTFALRGDVGSL
eukprot:12459518-Alexandrium_andersonii.AAC.1